MPITWVSALVHRPAGTALPVLAALLVWACGDSNPTGSKEQYTEIRSKAAVSTIIENGDTVLTLSCTKWPRDARAAVSITYDAPWGSEENHHLATDAIFARKLHMDIEMVSAKFLKPKMAKFLPVYRQELIPNGIHFFGHGHTHALHDTMEFDAAYESFSTNMRYMKMWGLHPKAYAYPGSSGRRLSTQLANKSAGFICARGSTVEPEEYYIVPGNVTEPKNWYYLPSVVMGSESVHYVHNHEQLVPILDEDVRRTAWVILMYHAIGIPTGWGYYPVADFDQDLDAIVERGFWCGNMDDVACYVKERAHLYVDLSEVSVASEQETYALTLGDDLDNRVYDYPLTFELEVAPRDGWSLSRVEDAHGDSLAVVVVGAGPLVEFAAVPNERPLRVFLQRR